MQSESRHVNLQGSSSLARQPVVSKGHVYVNTVYSLDISQELCGYCRAQARIQERTADRSLGERATLTWASPLAPKHRAGLWLARPVRTRVEPTLSHVANAHRAFLVPHVLFCPIPRVPGLAEHEPPYRIASRPSQGLLSSLSVLGPPSAPCQTSISMRASQYRRRPAGSSEVCRAFPST
jgi:hypothetical protein